MKEYVSLANSAGVVDSVASLVWYDPEDARHFHSFSACDRHHYPVWSKYPKRGTISKLLGHANPTITQNIYVHWRDERIHQAAMDVEVCGEMLQKSAKPRK